MIKIKIVKTNASRNSIKPHLKQSCSLLQFSLFPVWQRVEVGFVYSENVPELFVRQVGLDNQRVDAVWQWLLSEVLQIVVIF